MPSWRAREALAKVRLARDGALDQRYLGTVSSSPAVFVDVVPPEWRDHYAALAAAWMRQHGTIPPSLETLARWDAGVALEDELAYLEGRSPDPCSK